MAQVPDNASPDRHVLELGQLLGEVVGTRRRVVRDRSGAHLLRCSLDTRAHERKVRIDLILVERGELFSGSERSAGAQQGNGGDGEQRGKSGHRALHDALLCSHPVAGAAMFSSADRGVAAQFTATRRHWNATRGNGRPLGLAGLLLVLRPAAV